MQKLSYYGRSQSRLPMVDVTNIQARDYYNSKPTMPEKQTKGESFELKSYTSRLCVTESSRCIHNSKIIANSGKHFNCEDCGAYLSKVTIIS